MTRPEVSVVMPFAGSGDEARAAAAALRRLELRPGDELILVDNSGTGAAADLDGGGPPVRVITASAEPSPAHARNLGAAAAANPWILFLDADTQPMPGLIDAFWAAEIEDEVGAVAGEIAAAPATDTLVARYGGARSFLGQAAHHAHPYRPRAAAANLLVRRAAFEQLGGFYEGVRAAEDTDFTWRLQEAGWRLGLRPEARVEHTYRSSLSDLRRQWRGYAAGRAWLARRYEGFVPEPAVRRAARRAGPYLRSRVGRRLTEAQAASVDHTDGADRRRFLALDALLSLEELAGFALSNRPAPGSSRRSPAAVVLVADRFPAREDPLVELAGRLDGVRVEALGRPAAPDVSASRRLDIDYLEDDGLLARVAATSALLLRHPWRCLLDLAQRGQDEPPLRALASAVRRLERDRGARLHALGAGRSRATAERLAQLTGRALD